MKRLVCILLVVVMMMSVFGCMNLVTDSGSDDGSGVGDGSDIGGGDTGDSSGDAQQGKNLTIRISGASFVIILEENATSSAFRQLMPLSMRMGELNGNEKYFYLDTNLPTSPSRVGRINVGDVMLYGGNCLVIFYESFVSSYSYTRLGRIESTAGLKNALGVGSIEVVIDISQY